VIKPGVHVLREIGESSLVGSNCHCDRTHEPVSYMLDAMLSRDSTHIEAP